jgi:catechol 2,3-dioxygenase-like lactoylglutathione lyase family enzyme
MIFIALNVSDVERSVAFYENAFGLEFHCDENEPKSDVWYGGYHAAISWTQGSFLHFALFPALLPQRPVSRDAQLGLSVDNIHIAHEKAASSGARIEHGPRPEPWGVTARYRDPDGNLISITQRS